MAQFEIELREMLTRLRTEEKEALDDALKLSDQIHEHETNGNDLTPKEEQLWSALTLRIEALKKNPMFKKC